ncbi:hypothetical protein HYPSUDRAFT_59646 [Hypholoma sublateritium FD-334 SS-4]|uniref:Uncharacterized protein n=1 Tax=Hypholoma sublateritium (strain FD-334 SS-4) TaxID=945553 RepID=A0A0D2NZR8_HYPSF|nr:hypothetical protein HYPSUDRAFT_59646 [Hypholoma sublateritium FD-334 SS-4]
MITSFQRSVASAFFKVLQFFCMASAHPNVIPFEKLLDSHGANIELYIENLVNGYNAHGAAANRMQDYGVHKLYRCKERTEVGHEYVSAMVVGPQPSPPFYVTFERLRGTDDPEKHTSPSEESAVDAVNERRPPRLGPVKVIIQASGTAMQASSDISKQSSPFLQDCRAVDRVSIFENPTKKETDEINTTVAFKHPIPLYKIAVLAHTVHCSETTYVLSSSNCYFYTTAIMQVMEKVYGKEIQTILNSNTTRTTPGMVPLFHRTPMSKSYSKTKIDVKTCQKIIDSYECDLKTFVKNAQIKDKQLEQEAARANSEAARADREARRAAEVEAENQSMNEELSTLRKLVGAQWVASPSEIQGIVGD